jgi:four helix bundle protein
MASVLIIDDDEHVTRLLESHLQEEGHKIVVAHDGEQGMNIAQRMVPDLIMLDVFLGDSTGYQMCNRLRKNANTQKTPIIMMTGAARFPNQQMYGRERGANEYIFKPFNIIEVAELIRKYIQPVAAEAEKPASDLVSMNAMFKQALGKSSETVFEEVKPSVSTNGNGNGHHSAPEIDPLSAFAFKEPPVPAQPEVKPEEVVFEKKIVVDENSQPPVMFEETGPILLASKERFIDLGLEVYVLAAKMMNNRAEAYLADQLLRTTLAVGARINESRTSANRRLSLTRLQEALKELREAGYWLTMTKRVGLLDSLGKSELETTCQTLISLLADFIRSEHKKLPK